MIAAGSSAQVEHAPYKGEVAGAIPAPPTFGGFCERQHENIAKTTRPTQSQAEQMASPRTKQPEESRSWWKRTEVIAILMGLDVVTHCRLLKC